ncbi:hypothetical protein [Microbispora rosea]|uniref:hypothetical protein n=1 Tax=Microbispora rosea TaxID=58117 RepID=UPI0012DF0966|nr:hypothetical protein [Microbispora rosea]
MHFSELYSITRTEKDDWFDTFLPMDTRLCVDPFLVYEDESPRWALAHDHILDFFAMVFSLVKESKGDVRTPAWQKARSLLIFPEPSEFCLGLAEGSPLGSGSGPGLQEGMLEGIKTAVGLGIDNVPHMEMLALFQGGMGLDRISDVVCNITKSYFIEYTQEVCRRHSIPTRAFKVRNAAWSDKFARWKDLTVELPINPYLSKPHPVLLVPEKFLRDIPVVTANEFWEYAWQNHAAELRNNFNYDVAYRVDKHMKARLARQNPRIVQAYLDRLEQEDHEPYPMHTDPNVIVNWYEMGQGLAQNSPLSFSPDNPGQFNDFISAMIAAFKHHIEEQDGWQLLWYKSRSRAERAVQALFRGSVIHYCRAHNIDLSGESDAGRGPVDFKFSQGWASRALVEMKLMRNSKFWDGLLAQTPQYAVSEEVKSAFFVAIAYTDADMEESRRQKIDRAASIATNDKIAVTPVIIDARPKPSASHVRAASSDRDKLHERGEAGNDEEEHVED